MERAVIGDSHWPARPRSIPCARSERTTSCRQTRTHIAEPRRARYARQRWAGRKTTRNRRPKCRRCGLRARLFRHRCAPWFPHRHGRVRAPSFRRHLVPSPLSRHHRRNRSRRSMTRMLRSSPASKVRLLLHAPGLRPHAHRPRHCRDHRRRRRRSPTDRPASPRAHRHRRSPSIPCLRR